VRYTLPFKIKIRRPTPWERFLKKVKKQDNGCWVWIGANGGSGYGTFKGHTKVMLPHRFAYEETNKVQLKSSDHVRHKCDTPLCVNPDHLTLGSPRSNAQDRWKRTGRSIDRGLVLRRVIKRVAPEATEAEIAAVLRILRLSADGAA
jgi:hypothetical protein